jgi:capsular polysaccharide transport system permease protein
MNDAKDISGQVPQQNSTQNDVNNRQDKSSTSSKASSDVPELTKEERANRRQGRAAENALQKRRADKPLQEAETLTQRPVASPAAAKPRHWGMLIAFLIVVALPIATSVVYLYGRAVDQYASTLGFTVRADDSTSATDLLSGLGATFGGGTASRDTDILYEFIRSQEIVRKIDAALDLKTKYSRYVNTDPLLSYDPTQNTIEDLTDYWQRMVRIAYDNSSGLMELRVLAFNPSDATQIAEAVLSESTEMINALSAIARDDATRYAQQDLDLALERLKSAREALTTFRLANRIVDPNANIQAQMGLLTTLQAQQANALIEYDLISEIARDDDPRVAQARRRIEVIESRIDDERRKFGVGGGVDGGVEYATTVADFERLQVDREYAERAYAAALSAFDASRAEANRQSLYLAAYITPTLAEKSEYPQRELIVSMVALFSFLIWAIASLVYYALRDRK